MAHLFRQDMEKGPIRDRGMVLTPEIMAAGMQDT